MVQKSKLFGRRFKDGDGELTSVDANMVQGQLQLAMEETEERQGRDERAISWVLDSMTQDAEMESLVMAIPGSFDEEWVTAFGTGSLEPSDTITWAPTRTSFMLD